VNNLNELTTTTNGGTLTVAGATTPRAVKVTVNSVAAALYGDYTFALAGFTLTNGNNTFTAVANDVYGGSVNDTVSMNLSGTNNYSYDLNGNLLSDGNRCFACDDENELTSVWVTNTWRSDFLYDGKMRRRIRREYTWNGTWKLTNEVHYIYDGNRVLCFDLANRKVSGTITTPEPPSGLVLSANGARLYVTCAAPESKVCIVDTGKLRIVGTIPAGHTAMAPVLSPDGKTLYVCNRFNNDVSVIDLAAKKEVRRIAVQREPVAAAITKDGKYLLVANHLQAGRADRDAVSAVVSVIDVAAGKAVKELQLPSGSGVLNDIRISPDGQYAVATHIYSSFFKAASEVQFGWMNANAMTIIDVPGMEVRYTLLLDERTSGAANPWGAAWSADGTKVVVAHAGTHEVSVIDFPKLPASLPDLSTADTPTKKTNFVLASMSRYEGLAPPFLVGARQRIKLTASDSGPRSVVVVGHRAYAANYFSDTISIIDLTATQPKAESVPLGPKHEMSAVRKGEFYFNDAGICHQGWQSCASCHPGDARADGLNWDLLNDGIGNPKNTKSLLLAHKTPPSMSLGVRENAESAVRSGIKNILFTTQPEEVAAAIDEYLKSLKPVPSPYLVLGKLSEAAKRGRELFSEAGCADCHVPGLYTDLNPHDVGTRVAYDRPADKFYTPTLIEVWRTAPYLHDGSAATMRDVLTTRNPQDEHGTTSRLSPGEIDDLCAYVLSL
jgi:YVTN family beta-propeller protein